MKAAYAALEAGQLESASTQFETLVAQRLGLPSQICVYGETCGKAVVVEHDGSVYSCDHYVYPEHRLGNLHETPLSDPARDWR